MPNAIISVHNKEGIAEFAKELVELKFNIYSSGGTAKHLKDAGVAVTDIATIVGEPILGHRVVTLSREIHAGILARDCPEDREELARLKVPWFDLVCVDFYPLKNATSDPNATHESVIEMTDIGGPTMVRSAAKGRRIVICRAVDRGAVINWLKNDCPEKEEFLNNLAARAEFEVAKYCLESARFHSHSKFEGFLGEEVANCKYGENAYQQPAKLYAYDPYDTHDGLTLDKFINVRGQLLSYNNFCDTDRELQTATHIAAAFDKNYGRTPYIAIAVKHGNACGAGIGEDKVEVLKRMIIGDTIAIFGGVVITNFTLDEEEMDTLLTFESPGKKRLLDAIIAPGITPKAAEKIEKTNISLLINNSLANLGIESLDFAKRFRYVRGGFLTQPNYTFVMDMNDPNLIKSMQISPEEEKNLLLAWAIGSTANSNTIAIAKGEALIGLAVGQQDRVGAAQLAVNRARRADHITDESVAYSDSFFPFPDGPELLIKARIKSVLTSSGSIKDDKIKEVFTKNEVNLYMIPDELGRGFFGH